MPTKKHPYALLGGRGVGGDWQQMEGFIIRDLLLGVKRFGELKTSVGVSYKVLTANLRELKEDGLVRRAVWNTH